MRNRICHQSDILPDVIGSNAKLAQAKLYAQPTELYRVNMSTYHFMLIVEGPDLQAQSMIDALFDAGCGDAAVGSAHGVQYVDFDREAETFDEAMLSAVDYIEKLDGVKVVRTSGVRP